MLSDDKVKDIQSKGIYNVAVLEEGKVVLWPFQKNDGKFIHKPILLPFPPNTIITSVSCGYNFIMYL